MQATRVIKYGTTAGGVGSNGQIFSAATTWGQLLSESTDLDALSITPGMVAVIKVSGGGQNYKPGSPDFNLPTESFSVYFIPDKNNSGYGRHII
jgi:hypothetical protein